MEHAFKQIAKRCEALRITQAELRDKAGITAPRYWRAKNGITGQSARIKVVRQVEKCLDRLEREADRDKG